MGMSAGQARLLSITAKLTDNELRSQMLTNSKLRLADKSTEASSKYMDALNSQQLMYTSYDGSGNKISQALTANTILSFADMKNQYAMVNTSGQILVSSTDIKNFESSETMSDFISKYGVGFVDNQEYIKKLTNIFGDNYESFLNGYDEENKTLLDFMNTTYLNTLQLNYSKDTTDSIFNKLSNILNLDDEGMKNLPDNYTALITNYTNAINEFTGSFDTTLDNLGLDSNLGGLLSDYINIIKDLPDIDIASVPARPMDTAPQPPEWYDSDKIDDNSTDINNAWTDFQRYMQTGISCDPNPGSVSGMPCFEILDENIL